jgi:hypothetical protein
LHSPDVPQSPPCRARPMLPGGVSNSIQTPSIDGGICQSIETPAQSARVLSPTSSTLSVYSPRPNHGRTKGTTCLCNHSPLGSDSPLAQSYHLYLVRVVPGPCGSPWWRRCGIAGMLKHTRTNAVVAGTGSRSGCPSSSTPRLWQHRKRRSRCAGSRATSGLSAGPAKVSNVVFAGSTKPKRPWHRNDR